MTKNNFILRSVIAIAICLAGSATAFAQEEETGVVVNGVTWATNNAGTSVTEGYGNFYDFYMAQQACPTGWRVPTLEEWQALCDKTKVAYQWTNVNGIKGAKFTDTTTGVSVFLPAAGFREHDFYSFIPYAFRDEWGKYWSSTNRNTFRAYRLSFASYGVNRVKAQSHLDKFSVRCVKK